MSKQLEAELREVLAARASAVPASSIQRLSSAEYSPRVRQWSSRARLAATAGGLGGTAAIVTVVLATGAPAAFAGWRSVPTPATRTQTASADAACQGQLATLGSGSWTPVVQDQRGPYSLVVFEDGSQLANCLTGPSLTTVNEQGAGRGIGSAVSGGGGGPGAVRSGSSGSIQYPAGSPVEQSYEDQLTSTAGGAFSIIDVQAGSEVSAVTFDLSDSTQVQATLGEGWALAWWPDTAQPVAAEVTTPSGEITQPLRS